MGIVVSISSDETVQEVCHLILQLNGLRQESYRHRQQHEGKWTQETLEKQFQYVRELQEKRAQVERALPWFYLEFVQQRQCYALIPRPQRRD